MQGSEVIVSQEKTRHWRRLRRQRHDDRVEWGLPCKRKAFCLAIALVLGMKPPLGDESPGSHLDFVLPSQSGELIIGRLRLEILLESRA